MIDVSDYQKTIDWHKVMLSGVQRAYVKAWEWDVDPYFAANMRHAEAFGITVGAYCFGHPRLDPVLQAQAFVRVCKPFLKPGNLPPCLDLEVDDGHTADYLIRWKSSFFAVVDEAAGCRAVLYSDRYWLGYLVPHIYPDRPVWGAVPGGKLTAAEMARWSFCQYGQGKVPGIDGPVDLDEVLHPDAVPAIPAPAAT